MHLTVITALLTSLNTYDNVL